jgi:hypothetical protein
MENWPWRSPLKASKRLLGSAARSGEIGGGLQNAQPLFGLSFETMKCRDEFALRKLSRPFVPVAQYHPGKYK